MTSEYFQTLREKGRMLDEGIERLTQTWEMPHLLVGGYGDCASETKGYIEDMKKMLEDVNNGVDVVMNDVNNSDNTESNFIQQAELIFYDLKEQSESLESVLSEYGYRYEGPTELEQKVQEETMLNIDMEKCSMSFPKNQASLDVQFTPDLSWKCKAKPKDFLFTPADDKRLPLQNVTQTPVTKFMNSIQNTPTPVSRKY